ncbi:PEP-CTERM sorting domain-containing protein [Planctomycetota bacterium]
MPEPSTLLLLGLGAVMVRRRKFLTVQGDFGKIIAVIRRKLCFVKV